MNKRGLVSGVLTLSLIGPLLAFPETSFAAENETDNIPVEVLNEVEKTVEENQFDIPETEAWEVDLDGQVKEVTPLSERADNSHAGISVMSVPSDGYTYDFQYYSVGSPKKNWKFKSAGTVRVKNTSKASAKFTYTQQSSTTTQWDVSVAISGSAEIKNSFFGKIQASLGVTVDRKKSWSKGTSYGISTTVPKNSTAYLTAYAVGVRDKGRLVYKKYTRSGTLVGYYYESTGGTAVSKNDANIELTRVSPL
ncbi:YfkD family protein (plasmid) [Exiguobacterium acetylicum]